MQAEPNPLSLDAVLSRIEGVDGWLTTGQATLLFEAATRVPSDGRIVEIGSFRGRSTIVLASAAALGAEIVAIDPHAGNDRGPNEIEGFVAEAQSDNEIFLANLTAAGVAGRVRHLRMFSDAALPVLPGPVDVLYVDGAHRFGPARADIRDWGRRVVPGGTLLVHDSFSSVGVTLAILVELMFSSRFRYVGRSRSLAEFSADMPAGWLPRVGNALRIAGALPWWVKNLAVKAIIAFRLGPIARLVIRRDLEWPY
jgi:predicted O-methyltransferase YrrM